MPDFESCDPDFSSSADWGAIPGVGTVEDAARTPGFVTLRQILFPRTLPDLPSLGEAELSELLQNLELELLQRNYRVDFLDRLPARAPSNRFRYRSWFQMNPNGPCWFLPEKTKAIVPWKNPRDPLLNQRVNPTKPKALKRHNFGMNPVK